MSLTEAMMWRPLNEETAPNSQQTNYCSFASALVLRFHSPRIEGSCCQNDKMFPRHSISNSCPEERMRLNPASFPWWWAAGQRQGLYQHEPQNSCSSATTRTHTGGQKELRQSPFSASPMHVILSAAQGTLLAWGRSPVCEQESPEAVVQELAPQAGRPPGTGPSWLRSPWLHALEAQEWRGAGGTLGELRPRK